MSVRPGIYRHFKGHQYTVIAVFTHTETGEHLVGYTRDGPAGPEFWVRPLASFESRAALEDGSTVPRFVRESD